MRYLIPNRLYTDFHTGNLDSFFAFLWISNSWYEKLGPKFKSGDYLAVVRGVEDSLTGIRAIEAKLKKGMLVVAAPFVIWGFLASIFAFVAGEFPGLTFYFQNAVCVAICLYSSWLVIKRLCKYERTLIYGAYEKYLADNSFDKMTYEKDLSHFKRTFSSLQFRIGPHNFDDFRKIVQGYVTGNLLRFCEDVVLDYAQDSERQDVCKRQERYVQEEIDAAKPFGIFTDVDAKGLIAQCLEEAKQKAKK